MTDNYFTELNNVNVNDKTEKKGKLTYLSWAYAWAEIKKRHPTANYKIYEHENGCFYWTDGRTSWVKVGVTINTIEHVEYLPVMDYNNQSIPTEQVTSFDVNKAIQRALTKACARHGLGLYIYAGEDLPEGETSADKPENPPTKEQLARLQELGGTIQAASMYYKKTVEEVTGEEVQKLIEAKERQLKKAEVQDANK